MLRTENTYVRVAAVWLGMVAIWLLLGALRDVLWGTGHTGYSLGGHVMSAVLATALAVPFVIAARRWLDGGGLAGIGLPVSAAALKPFAIGALVFTLPFAAAIVLVQVTGWAAVTPGTGVMEVVLFVPVLAVLVFLFEALPEELAFRGYIFTNLATRMGRVWAAIGQAVLFMLWALTLTLLSGGGLDTVRLSMFLVMGFVLGLLRVMAGSVWISIGFHTAFQTAAQLLLNESRGHFAITDTGTLQFVALGVVPFSLAVLIAGFFYPEPHHWLSKETTAS